MKKLIDGDISKFLSSFNIPVVAIDTNKDITWDEYMEIYNVMKECCENKKFALQVYYATGEDGSFAVDDMQIVLGIPDDIDTDVSEGTPYYNFKFWGDYFSIWNKGDGWTIETRSEWACGWRPNDTSDIEHKGLGKIEEWL